MRTKLSLSDRVAARTWYHKIDLGSGISTPGAPFGVVFDARIFSSRDPTVVGSVSPASTPSSKAPSWTVSIPIKMFFAHLKRNLASGGERAFRWPKVSPSMLRHYWIRGFCRPDPDYPQQAIDDARFDLLAPLAYGPAAIMPLRAALGGD